LTQHQRTVIDKQIEDQGVSDIFLQYRQTRCISTVQVYI